MGAMETRSREASIGMRDVVVSGDTIKILWFDGDGLCLFAKRLERGRFIWPQATEGTVSLTRAQLSMLLEGIDWRRPQRTWTPQIAV
jgi:transposase